MKIAIKFGDNDFGNTFLNVLKVLNSAFLHTGNLPIDKNKLCFIINNLSPVIYITHQNQYEYNQLKNVSDGLQTGENEEYVRVKKYLQITPDRILVNKEVEKYLKEFIDGDNSETFILDTDLNFDNNCPVYCW